MRRWNVSDPGMYRHLDSVDCRLLDSVDSRYPWSDRANQGYIRRGTQCARVMKSEISHGKCIYPCTAKQWFSTGMPCHTVSPKGAAEYSDMAGVFIECGNRYCKGLYGRILHKRLNRVIQVCCSFCQTCSSVISETIASTWQQQLEQSLYMHIAQPNSF